MKSKITWWSVYALGLLFCIVPPAIAVLAKFTVWQTGQRVSASVILLLAVCCIPMWKQLRNALKHFAENPSAWGIWLALDIVFRLFNAISADMLTICNIALPASVIGALIMALAHKKIHKEDEF